MSSVVLFEKRNNIAYVTINRPERRNSLNAEVRRLLALGVAGIISDDLSLLGSLQALASTPEEAKG